jgi:predicted peptidase
MSIQSGTQQVQTFKTELPESINSSYLVYLPQGYDPQSSQRWPFILFLHGAGERGSDIEHVRLQGLPKILEHKTDFPFIVVSPQCSAAQRWSSDALSAALDEAVSTYNVDTDRIYLTGLSMGGYGTWDLAMAYPRKFAAIAPICGGGDVGRVCTLQHLPIWVFHGAKDTIVPVEYSEKLVAALQNCGGNVRFTVYPDAEHDSWTQTYANPELYSWLLEHTCKDASSSG